MKCLSTIFLILIFLEKSFSQGVELPVFLDGCKSFKVADSVNLVTLNGEYLVNSKFKTLLNEKGVNYLRGNTKEGSFNIRFYSEESFDTLEIPKLKMQRARRIIMHHSPELFFINCGEIINGDFIETWQNGNLRHEGVFENGKPKVFKQYNQKGTIISIDYYHPKKVELNKSEYYDSYGLLEWYILYGSKKSRVFDDKGKRVRKKHLKNFLEEVNRSLILPIYWPLLTNN
ncbi:hypothetical protein [uncultured Roseivirga sp.]|uniref:hypothetical protein n=1 Tax=uncultured Roseivirga sp. TaxID=543088 RepID=UPI0030DB1478|tara:strand:- start:56 stop:745 length:690 start_codon:yes stop_codon:yes gene_type:complete